MTTTSNPETDLSPTAKKARKGRPTCDELRDRTLHHDRLWHIEDVAVFLGCSVRLASDVVKDPTVPAPRLVTRGGERRWSPTHWYRWMDDDESVHLAGAVAPSGTAPGGAGPGGTDSGDVTEMAAL